MSEKFKGKYRGQTFRLQTWDYSSEGLYFVTICTFDREHFFGEIKNGKMVLSEIGEIVASEWVKTPDIRPDMNLELGEFVVMPNHFHAVIYIGSNKYNDGSVDNCNCRVPMHCDPTITVINPSKNKFGPQSKNLASIIRGFKSAVTTWCRKNNYPNFKWQSLFHDHIIRNQQAFDKIQNYIINNPKNWKDDTFFK
jgi:REP element-mobilizing transposase RayT